MSKIKKFIYPFAFSVSFAIFYITLLVILSSVLGNGNYAGAAWAVVFVGIWALLIVPCYCNKYCKVIYEEKLKYLFAVYNCLVLCFFHLMFFNFDNNTYIFGVIFSIWVLYWTVSPLIFRLISNRLRNKDNVNS